MSLVMLEAGGADTPVFLVHGASGTVLVYRALAARLAGRPVLGLEARGVDGEREPLECVEAMAAAYIDEIRARGAPDSWLLAGWSFGGLVAFEMAVQLGRAGARACAALLDTRALVDREKLDAAGETGVLAVPYDSDSRGGGALWPLRATLAAHTRALARYRPSRAGAPLLVVRAARSAGSSLADRDEQAAPYARDATLGFGAHAGAAVQVAEVPGDHESMLAPPEVDAAAALLRAFFEAFEASAVDAGPPRS